MLKPAREKQKVADSLSETLQSKREWQDIFKVMKGKKKKKKITVPSKGLIQN